LTLRGSGRIAFVPDSFAVILSLREWKVRPNEHFQPQRGCGYSRPSIAFNVRQNLVAVVRCV
jgi:hypothetical protein